MVHTRNGSSYSVQPDGPGQGRGKTRTSSSKSSSRKTHLEDARAAPIPQGLNHFQVAAIEIYQSQYRYWFRAVGNMPKPLAGGHELQLTHQELSGSGEDHRTLRRVEPIVLQRQGKKDKEFVEEPKSFICIPEEGIGNDPSFGRRPNGIYQLQKHPKRSPKDLRRRRKVSRTIRERAKAKKIGTDLTHKGTGSPNWSLQLWIVSSIWPVLGYEIKFVKYSIDVELCKFDAKLNKITSDISELKRNDKNYTEWYKLTNVKLYSITSTCDRIESKCKSQNDEMEDLSILNINDQLRILKDHVFEIIDNTNQFATHLEKSDSERQKLKNEISAIVEKINKNSEPHIPSYSTPLTEEKLSVKGSLTPFLGENTICAKNIPKLKEWPTFSGEGEYNHIEFIRKIDILKEDVHIPDEIIVEDHINSMEDIITRTRIGKTWVRVPMEFKMVSRTSREDKRPERPVLKCHKCGSTSHLANTCTKKAKINEVKVIEEVQCTEEKEESDLDSTVSEDTPVEDYPT
ncbi:hypothetical protein O181_095285 [Austropuccinia psidii MF-1]|uniref:CCHC-type domain-containing protein n=1 Tax=Austropuccinia psidii MF-1 TaxID=1389203 RepID=A0A9Q3J3J1_9BASI|nr:hypothetical protein [Austropuccinia psidii MF-1]